MTIPKPTLPDLLAAIKEREERARQFWIDSDDWFAADNNWGKRAIHVREQIEPKDGERMRKALQRVDGFTCYSHDCCELNSCGNCDLKDEIRAILAGEMDE